MERTLPGLTSEQAAAIGRVLETADGGCYVCAGRLADEMAAIWPEHDWSELVRRRPEDWARDLAGANDGT